jgi:hypothetical protein
MLKFLIGPVLLGAGYAAGSYYGADAEQLVHKSPSVTYAAVEDALAGVRQSGTTFFEGGNPVPYELKVDRTLDQRLVISLDFDGKQGAQADLEFTPASNGSATLIAARIHGDRSVLRTALAGTSRARLAYAPDWMLNLSAKPVLQQLAEQIEQDGDAASAFRSWSPADAEAKWESNLSDVQRQQVATWRQNEATRPAVDPNADAQRFMSGTNQSSR